MRNSPPPSRVAATHEGRWKRIGWFVGLWIAGVSSVAALAYFIRWAIQL